jgi:serine/threonine-protein kinase PknK
VLALMAEGRSNAGIAGSALARRGNGREARPPHPRQAQLPETKDDHRRVLAVVTFLKSSKEKV